jgi:hypothetical protein
VLSATAFTVEKGSTTTLELGALVFNVAEELKQAPIEAILIAPSGSGSEVLRIEPHGNDYYLLRPKVLPPGTYSVAFLYRRSETPATLAEALEILPGQETYLTLDTGIQVIKPRDTALSGWDLADAATGRTVLSVRRGWDNEEPLWRTFPVFPGRYSLNAWVKGMDEPLPVADDLAISAGQTLRFDMGL